ncbi:phenylacetic acid degradation protein PaaN [Streptomyces sp. ODS28]|uniref:phenylacetic acid degradation protein PaaN n=1 Tax=Streptomyces sp. ODS28 TaxID=3136688 RepID=UPI0031E8D5E4
MLRRHRPTLERALEVISTRESWSPFPEGEEGYPPGAAADGEAAFRALLDRPFDLDQPGGDGAVGPAPEQGGEISPYGFPLGVSYPHADADRLLPALRDAREGWAAAGPWERAAVCAEILFRLNSRAHELAHAAVHTSGHNFLMAFHAGAVHAQDRGLEAVAYALREQTRIPYEAVWSKPMPGGRPFVLDKTFTAVPRGVALVVGNRVFPAWNGYPGLFASLATGNSVLVKPHPRAVLPLALTVRTAREVLREAGFSPDLVCLAAERPGEELAASLAVRPEVRLIDYSGTTAFGCRLVREAGQARVRTATSAVNALLIHSTAHYRDMLDNLAFSLALYSGQLCTSPQNLLIPRTGIATDEGHKSFAQVVSDLGDALSTLLADDGTACAVLGALVGPDVAARVEHAATGAVGPVAVPSRTVAHPDFPGATVRTPLVVRLDADDPADLATLKTEWLGPVFFAVAVDSAAAGTALLRETAQECGALSAGVHTTSPEVEEELERACAAAGVLLSVNLRGDWYITQSAVYSDLHSTGLNPSGDAPYCDGAFVADRFRTVEVRRFREPS